MYKHKFVNAGFYTRTMVCKWCNKEDNEKTGRSCPKHPDRICVIDFAEDPKDIKWVTMDDLLEAERANH